MKRIYPLLLAVLLIQAQVTRAQLVSEAGITHLSLKKYTSKWEYGAEYLVSTANANQINTVNMQAYFWKQYFKNTLLLVNVGAVASYARGYVSRWTSDMADLYWDSHRCSAVGLGPSLQLQYTFMRKGRFSMEGEANGAFLLYSTKFPYGGRIYNFMFRAGPNFCWDMGQAFMIKAGYRWMHVSNGTGPGPQNPFYEGQGLVLSVAKFIP